MKKNITGRVVVIPCFNEEKRFKFDFFIDLVDSHSCKLIFVDDGSTDGTYSSILSFPIDKDSIHIIRLDRNAGKANAVRHGINYAIDKGFQFIGLYDADGAINPTDMGNAFQIIENSPGIDVVSGARILLAGNNVSRTPYRKWAGRIIATLVSLILQLQVYDPQSPCKVYRASGIRNLSTFAIKTKWFVDAEILKMLNQNAGQKKNWLIEFPVTDWDDVSGSNISIKSLYRITKDLLSLIVKK
jgi:glycosyltransferase involved in cell wall biosynthesis